MLLVGFVGVWTALGKTLVRVYNQKQDFSPLSFARLRVLITSITLDKNAIETSLKTQLCSQNNLMKSPERCESPEDTPGRHAKTLWEAMKS